tara:strand:+ start:69 stop:497 length:429 start_codon:yes stop_codon:yes gene_type:complete
MNKHCNLCKHIDARLSDGVFCSLNGERPNFKNSCPTFKLGESSRGNLKELNDELNRIKTTQKSYVSRFYFLVTLGTIITLLGYYFFEFNHKSIYLTKFSSIICGIGLTFWTIALQRKFLLTSKRKRIENRIEEFEQVLRNYN